MSQNKIEWRGNRAFVGDSIVALSAETYSGVKIGIYDAEGDSSRDGIPGVVWHDLSIELDNTLSPIPEESLLDSRP